MTANLALAETESMLASIVIGSAHDLSDESIYAGLGSKTVRYLNQSVEANPSMRRTLAKAAKLRAQTPKRDRTAPEYVYFIQNEATGGVKIGSASDPVSRLKSLQTGNEATLRLLAVVPGGQKRERELQAQFRTSRIRGEWFRPSLALLDYIAEVAQ